MGNWDQDAVDEAIRILQPQIDELKARPVAKRPVRVVQYYDNGTFDTFDLVPVA